VGEASLGQQSKQPIARQAQRRDHQRPAPLSVSTELTLLMVAAFEISSEEFRRRRKLATRRGSPAWLWPEVEVSAWAEAVSLVTEAVGAILRGEQPLLPRRDVTTMSLACYTTGVGPVLGFWSRAGLLRAHPEVDELLSLHLKHATARHERVSAQARELAGAFAAKDIGIIVLKGGHTAQTYFPHPATRPSSDLDLLVRPDQARQAEMVLEERGFEAVTRSVRESGWTRVGDRREPRSLWMVHTHDPWSIDLHRSLDFSPTPGGRLVRLDLADPFAGTEAWETDATARVLRQPLLLLHLAVHASGGMHSLTLLRMVEIILVVRHDLANGRLRWDEFVALAEQTDGLGAAYPALAMCEELAPATIPAQVLGLCANACSRRGRAVMKQLKPATAHRVHRASLSEHFMWTTGLRCWIRQLVSDVAPPTAIWPIYQARAYRLLRGRFSR